VVLENPYSFYCVPDPVNWTVQPSLSPLGLIANIQPLNKNQEEKSGFFLRGCILAIKLAGLMMVVKQEPSIERKKKQTC
jgi:hypothetical protein